MKSFTTFTGYVAGLNKVNVDTDQIIPKQFLKRIERTGFGQFLFYDWRFNSNGESNPNFELNKRENQNTEILIAGQNFGCGSSREHAPWALQDYGIRVVIAPSFADIFYTNCLKNGLLPIRLDETIVSQLMGKSASPDYKLTVDLINETVYDSHGLQQRFLIDSYWKDMLVNGWDEIDLTLKYEEEIVAFENNR
jgi:3-isopropylmalate/(R)-2-methylmalate dehydratase small subunit